MRVLERAPSLFILVEKKCCSGWSISRVLSSPGYPRTDGLAKDGHLSRLTVTDQLVQPTRDSNGAGSSSSLLGLAPDGGCPAAAYALRRRVLEPPGHAARG